MNSYENFECHTLEDGSLFFRGILPQQLRVDADGFEALWHLHPEEYHLIKIHGRLVPTPRWQQAYGADYHYTGSTNRALPLPEEIRPILAWSRDVIHDELNGLLLNWYDGQLKHYIGPHFDSTKNMVMDAPIVTISLGEERIFRLSQPKTKRRRDFAARDGTVFITPFETNLAWKHGVPHSASRRGRRISITIRAFEEGTSAGVQSLANVGSERDRASRTRSHQPPDGEWGGRR